MSDFHQFLDEDEFFERAPRDSPVDSPKRMRSPQSASSSSAPAREIELRTYEKKVTPPPDATPGGQQSAPAVFPSLHQAGEIEGQMSPHSLHPIAQPHDMQRPDMQRPLSYSPYSGAGGAYPQVQPPQPPEIALPRSQSSGGGNSTSEGGPPPPASNRPVGIPVSQGYGEIICPYCSVCLRFPQGSELVKCGQCHSISRVPPPLTQQQQMMQQMPQQLPQPAPGAIRVQFKCGGRVCPLWLAADVPTGQKSTLCRCPSCLTLSRPTIGLMPEQASIQPLVQQPVQQQAPPIQQISQPHQVAGPRIGAQVQPMGLNAVAPQSSALPAAQQQLAQHQQVAQQEQADMIRAYQASLASNPNASLSQAQHDEVVRQQAQIIEQANAARATQKEQERQAMLAQEQALAQAHAQAQANMVQSSSSSSSSGIFSNIFGSKKVAQTPLPNHGMVVSSSGSNYMGQPEQPQRRLSGDYSSASYTPSAPYHPTTPAHSNYVAVAGDDIIVPSSAASAAAAREEKDRHEEDALFQAQMAARLEALHVDEEGGERIVAPTVKAPKTKSQGEKASALLANPM